MLRIVRERWLERTGADEAGALRPRAGDRRPARGRARSPATPTPAPRSRSRSPTASSPASAGSATTSSWSSRWPPTAPSRSARSATTARWRRSRPSARTSPTTSRRRSPSSPTRRSTASARSSTSRPARCSAAAPRSTTPAEDTGTVETSFPVILGGHHDMAPLSDKTYRRIAREHQTYLLEDLWEEFRGRAAAIDISLLESETTQGAIERLKQEAVKKVRDGAELLVLTDRTVYDGERRYLDPHLAISAVDQALKQFQRRARRGEPAPALRDRPALGGDPQRPRRDARARPRRQRRLPLRDGRGDLRRGLRERRRQPLRGAAQGDREGDLDDRHPRGARLRAPVLLDRDQAGAGRDLPDRGLRRLGEGRRRLRRARRRHRRARADPRRRGGARSRRRPSASTPRSTRRRSRPPTAPATTTSTRRRCATSRRRARSRCATSWA